MQKWQKPPNLQPNIDEGTKNWPEVVTFLYQSGVFSSLSWSWKQPLSVFSRRKAEQSRETAWFLPFVLLVTAETQFVLTKLYKMSSHQMPFSGLWILWRSVFYALQLFATENRVTEFYIVRPLFLSTSGYTETNMVFVITVSATCVHCLDLLDRDMLFMARELYSHVHCKNSV